MKQKSHIFLLLVLTACQSKPTKAPADAAPTTRPAGPVTVSLTQAQYDQANIQLGQPQNRAVTNELTANGTLDVPPQYQVTVAVPVGGYVRSIRWEVGAKILKGQPVATLENPEFITMQQDYLDLSARTDYATLEFARQQELARDNVNALKILQKARADLSSLQAQRAGLGQRLVMLGIDPVRLRSDHLSRTVVVPSPISGFVTNVPINNGKFVNPADVILEVMALENLHVHLSIYEKDISRIHVGQSIRFKLGGDGTMHRGRIFLIGKTIAADRTIPVLADPDEHTDQFIPGAYVSAQIAVASQSVPTLPDAAVVRFGGQSVVYILTGKSGSPATYRFRQVPVVPGQTSNGFTAIVLPADLNPTQTPVVVNGAYSLLAKLNNSEEE